MKNTVQCRRGDWRESWRASTILLSPTLWKGLGSIPHESGLRMLPEGAMRVEEKSNTKLLPLPKVTQWCHLPCPPFSAYQFLSSVFIGILLGWTGWSWWVGALIYLPPQNWLRVFLVSIAGWGLWRMEREAWTTSICPVCFPKTTAMSFLVPVRLSENSFLSPPNTGDSLFHGFQTWPLCPLVSCSATCNLSCSWAPSLTNWTFSPASASRINLLPFWKQEKLG